MLMNSKYDDHCYVLKFSAFNYLLKSFRLQSNDVVCAEVFNTPPVTEILILKGLGLGLWIGYIW